VINKESIGSVGYNQWFRGAVGTSLWRLTWTKVPLCKRDEEGPKHKGEKAELSGAENTRFLAPVVVSIQSVSYVMKYHNNK
jgi:hypothetical protein